MFVLRTAREVAAEAKGVDVTSITPEFELGPIRNQVVAELASRVASALVEQQVIDEPSDAAARMPLEDAIEGQELAAVAEAMTNAAVRVLISSRLDVPYDELETGLSFALDLGADSLTRVDLVLLLEETLEVSVPDDSMFLVQSVGDAELFAVLFDRTREEVVIALGEPARDLTFDTPLVAFGEEASSVALEAAARALGPGFTLPDCPCHTLKDVVRLAFLAEKLRRSLARAAGVEPRDLLTSTVPEQDLGIDAATTRSLIAELTASMDLGAASIEDGHSKSFGETLRTIAELSAEIVGGAPR